MAESPGCCSTWARCLRCLYSCHWRKCPKEKRKSHQCECFWFGLLFLTFLVSLGWLYVGLILLNDLHNFNEFLFRHWGHWMDWSLAFMLFVSLLVTYASLLLLLAVLLRLCGEPLHLHWVHKVLLFLIILLVAAGFAVLGVQWQEELLSLHLSLQATAPFLHIGAVVCITILAWPVADAFYRIHQRGRRIVLLSLFFGVVLAIYLSPLCISSPCIMESRHLPPKPQLMGTEEPPCNSLPQLAPENTLMSLRKTAECGAAVFETDVMVSSDGVPFLMHDERLSRTTDVSSVFPTRITAHSSDFSWAELKRLNAGAWFLERPPFWEAKKLSGSDRKEAENQRVPTLKELLKEAAALNLSIMFDLRRPPRNHTYYDTFVNQTLETVLDSRVSQATVMLPGSQVPFTILPQPPPSLGHSDNLELPLPQGPTPVYVPHPVVKPACSAPAPGIPGPPPALCSCSPNHRSCGSQMKIGLLSNNRHLACARYMDHQGVNTTERPLLLNLPYQDLPQLDMKALHEDNVSVNLFVVNKPWLFSLLWCAGVNSVTTNDCQLLQQMRYPVWLIAPQTYLMVWIATDCVSALLILCHFLLRGRCAEKRERTGLETAVLLTRINNVRRE